MRNTNLLRDEARKCRELAARCSLPDMALDLLAVAQYFADKAAELEAGGICAAAAPLPFAVPAGS